MPAYETDTNPVRREGGPIYENGETVGGSTSANSTVDDNGMEFYEELPISNQQNLSIPHKLINGVKYAVANVKGKGKFPKDMGVEDKDPGRAKQLPGKLI